jgi:hypothetical protein|tara:strand:- start:848 stop:1024 length:177 start_codon:yes stop_codon:yes gene_type:complete
MDYFSRDKSAVSWLKMANSRARSALRRQRHYRKLFEKKKVFWYKARLSVGSLIQNWFQ